MPAHFRAPEAAHMLHRGQHVIHDHEPGIGPEGRGARTIHHSGCGPFLKRCRDEFMAVARLALDGEEEGAGLQCARIDRDRMNGRDCTPRLTPQHRSKLTRLPKHQTLPAHPASSPITPRATS